MAAVRALDPRIAIVVAASNPPEGVARRVQQTFICDALEGVTTSMMRAVRERL